MLWPGLLAFLGAAHFAGWHGVVLGSFASQISLLAQLVAYFRATLANEKLFRGNSQLQLASIQLDGKW